MLGQPEHNLVGSQPVGLYSKQSHNTFLTNNGETIEICMYIIVFINEKHNLQL
jgi:hypothetical protein